MAGPMAGIEKRFASEEACQTALKGRAATYASLMKLKPHSKVSTEPHRFTWSYDEPWLGTRQEGALWCQEAKQAP